MKEWYKEFVFIVVGIEADYSDDRSAYVTVKEQTRGDQFTVRVEDAGDVKIRQRFVWEPSQEDQ